MCASKRLSEKERRKEIMDSAAKVILKKGFDNATMEDIVSGTTLSKGGVYHYYSSLVDIFKDIMILGIDYRNEIIKEHMNECKEGCEKEFIAKRLVEKILDDNPYMPLYVEFLIAKQRNKELQDLMVDLQDKARHSFEEIMISNPICNIDKNCFQFLTDFINSMIMGSNILNARGCFSRNGEVIKEMIILILEKGEEMADEGL